MKKLKEIDSYVVPALVYGSVRASGLWVQQPEDGHMGFIQQVLLVVQR
jgi:hypothetical protein